MAVLLLVSMHPSNAFAQGQFNLSNLRESNGIQFTGLDSGDRLSEIMATGDINGDGKDDIIIGVPEGAPGGRIRAGEVYVIFGDSSGFDSSTIDLSALDGTNGFVINGIDANDDAGTSVASGDVNGDGFDDVVIGAVFADPNGESSAGEVYVVFGQSGFGASFELSTLNGSNGITLNGALRSDNAGTAVAVGDIRTDGFADIAISAIRADPNGVISAGEVYVVFGRSSYSSSVIELGALNGDNGFTLIGSERNDRVGTTLAVGNFDGIRSVGETNSADLFIGAPDAGSNGFIYVLSNRNNANSFLFGFGNDSLGVLNNFNVNSLTAALGFSIIGGGDGVGDVLTSGDVNNDGFDDIITGLDEAGTGGETYVIFGRPFLANSLSDLPIDPILLDSPSAGEVRVINGFDSSDRAGRAVGSGDVNGDGVDDVIIGAIGGDPNGLAAAGETFVVFGDSSFAHTTSMDISTLDENTGFILNGTTTSGLSGGTLTTGDLNGDGVDEVLVGAHFADPNGISDAGELYVFFNKVSQSITGDEGFRTLSAPISGTVYDDVLGGFFTQGFTNSDAPSASDNVFVFDQATQAFVGLNDQNTDSLKAGHGFLFFIFSDNDNDGNAEGFPKTLPATQFGDDGTANTGTVAPVSNLNDGDFFLAGNPYSFPIDWDDAGITKTNLSNTIYIYDDANGQYQSWNGTVGNITDGEIQPFQGFFIEGSGGSGALSMTESAIADSLDTFLKRNPDAEPRALQLTATAGDVKTDAWLSFQEGGEIGRDAFDGLALQSFSATYLRLATVISNQDELTINALPVDQAEELRFPLELSGVLEADSASISFEGIEDFAGWSIAIHDLQTEEVHEIATSDKEIALPIQQVQSKQSRPVAPTPVAVKAKAGAHRFELVLAPTATSVNNEPVSSLPQRISLEQNYPNPFNPTTTIEYGVPQSGAVTLEVFDVTGRKVATLVDRQQQAGSYSVRFDASRLSSGMYFYRLEANGVTLTRKLTLIK
ncbi:MAG: T9SS type A sorting domain-containing protein [Bacteroidota bacterium]